METAILPEICAVRIDETEFWSDDVREKVDKIYGIYLIDKSSHTHLCSATPSYAMYYMGFSIYSDKINREELEELEMEMMANDCSEWVTYMNCSNIDSMDAENFDFDFTVDHDDYDYDNDRSYQEMINDMIGSYSENPTW